MQGPGENAVLERADDLDDPGDARGGLGMADIGLDGAEKQRLGAVRAVGGQQRLRLDRVAEDGAGAVCLHEVDVGGLERGRGECRPDDPPLGRAVGRGEAVGRAVGVHRGSADRGEHTVAVPAGRGQPLQQDEADTLAHAGAVGGVREGLAAPVRGQAALAGERGEHLGRRHDRGTTRDDPGAVTTAQGVDGEVDRDERRRTGRVDGQRRALQAEGVGDTPGDDAARVAGEQVPLDSLGDVVGGRAVAGVGGTDEDAGVAAAQPGRVRTRPLEQLPGDLQQLPLLRIHRQGLTRGDAEQGGVKIARTREEPTVAGVGGTGVVRIGVVQIGGPAPVVGERLDRVHAVGHQPPQIRRGPDSAGVPAGGGDHGDRLGVAGPVGAQLGVGLLQLRGDAAKVVGQLLLLVGHGSLTHFPSDRSAGR